MMSAVAIAFPETATTEIHRLPVDRLFVDPRYQAALSPLRVRRLEQGFDPLAAGLLIVSARNNGMFAVVDGQHRLAAIRNLGESHALCMVAYGLTAAEEAELFIKCNTNRKRPKAIDVFKARLEAGDPVAVEIMDIVESFGYRIEFDGKTPSKRGLLCVAALDEIHRHHGPEGLQRTLGVVLNAWPNNTLANQAIVIGGVSRFLAHYGAEIEIDQLTRRLANRDPSSLLRETRAITEVLGGHGTANFGRVLLKVWNFRRNEQNRLEDRFGR